MSLRARGVVGSAETRDRENVLLDQFSPSEEKGRVFCTLCQGLLYEL